MWVPFATRSSRAHSWFWKDHEARRVRNRLLMGAPLLLLPCLPARAQTTTTEFFPEFDTYFKPTSKVRIVFQAKETREGGDPTQVELGPSVEFYLKPLLQLKEVAVFDLDDSKSRPVVLSVGYRYVPSPDKPTVNRLEPVATFHIPMKCRILISDRNRFDLDWSNGSFTWRYRNRLTVERRVTIRSYHPGPYVSAEVYYESQYSKWEHHRTLCGLFTAGRQARPDRSVLRAREQHGKDSQSASERCGSGTRSLFLAQERRTAYEKRGNTNNASSGGTRALPIQA